MKISKKDTSIYNKRFKKISKRLVLMNPPIKTKTDNSLGVYYGMDGNNPVVVKCYDSATFKRNDSLNNMYGIFSGSSAKVIVNSKHRYYIMPYSNAGTLADLIKKDVRFTEKEISSFALQISEQLSKLHKTKDAYHGELTPEHILINKEDDETITYRICGFGHHMPKPKEYYKDDDRAKYLDSRVIEDPTETLDAFCDVWSLGILACKMFTGGFPEKDPDPDYEEGPYDYLDEVNNVSIPFMLGRLFSLCLYKNPTKRIDSASVKCQAFFIPERDDISDYVFDKELGEGKFGTVYLTYKQNDPAKKYAAKKLKQMIKGDKMQMILCLEEPTILRTMKDSPYITNVVDWFTNDEETYFVLEFFNGGDLFGFVESCSKALKKESIDEKSGWKKTDLEMYEDIRPIAFNLAHGLFDMHSKRLIHRDVKLDNMLISRDEKTKRLSTAKLSDLGASRRMLGKDAQTMVGTQGYMAPEMLFDGTYDFKADVWAYGVALYIVAFNTPLLKNNEKMYSTKTINYPKDTIYHFPPSFIDLIKRCIVFDTVQRMDMAHILMHPFFQENPCAIVDNIPSYYKVGKTLFDKPNFTISEITYTPTDCKLLLKKIKRHKNEEKKLINAINELIILRECPYIYKMHQGLRIGKYYYFILDYTDRKTLKDYVEENEQLSKGMIKKFAKEIAIAIQSIHSHGLAHNGISINNIYVCPDGDNFTVKLAGYCDFAQNVIEPQLPPEETKDIYEFGRVLHFMLYKREDTYEESADVSIVKPLEPKKISSGALLKQKCVSEEYTSIEEVLNDPYFTN